MYRAAISNKCPFQTLYRGLERPSLQLLSRKTWIKKYPACQDLLYTLGLRMVKAGRGGGFPRMAIVIFSVYSMETILYSALCLQEGVVDVALVVSDFGK